MKYLFHRETIFVTICVFIVMSLLVYIPLNLHSLDPLKLALTDINFNDLAFSKLKSHKSNKIDSNIIIINLGEGRRKDVSILLNKLNAYNTKVIGLDVVFETAKESETDQELAHAISNLPNIVLSDRMVIENDNVYHNNYFKGYSKHSGYVGFAEANLSVVRYFSPFEKTKDSVYPSFASAVVQLADKDKYTRLKKRKKQLELINYQREEDQYFIIPDSALFNNTVDSTVFRNKIVLIGYINKNPTNVEDKHFTPMNEKFVGKSLPDMNGVVIQANILSMILGGKYINKVPRWLNWLMAVILTWLFMAVAVKYYIERGMWFHIVTKVIQLGLAFLFVYIGIMAVHTFRLSIGFAGTLLAIILAVDVLYFYDAFVKWLHLKFGVKTIFHHKGH